MLSYRHAFHAGSHADVLKHFILVQLLQYLNRKDKPYWVIDTHAGAGLYALDQGYAAQNAEYKGGIARLWARNDLPPPLAEYVALVRSVNPDNGLKTYPGSPLLAQALIRRDDRLRLYELHPTDSQHLQNNFADAGRQIKMEKADGFAGLKALLPPPPRRGLILIDPPYEVKQDYQRVVKVLEESLKRFATGIYTVWYPMLQRQESIQFVGHLRQLPLQNWLHAGLTVHAPAPDGFGMHGSGMFIINPPWTLKQTLQSVMPFLTEQLAIDDGAEFVLEASE